MLSYKQAYDKIIDAYFKDEIRPMDNSFCFCGMLANNNWDWRLQFSSPKNQYHYTALEYTLMESALFKGMGEILGEVIDNRYSCSEYEQLVEDYSCEIEDAIFNGMCAALEVLKQIHIDRGEIIDEDLKLTKREKLQSCNTY